MLHPIRHLAILLTALGLVMSASAPAVAAGDATAVSPLTPGMVVSPARTDGDVVVWSEDAGTDAANADVLGAHLTDGKVFTIASGPDNQINPTVDDSVVIWTVSRTSCPPCDELHARDLSGGDEVVVASPGKILSFDDVSGHWVVWVTGNQILARDISTMADPVTVGTGSGGSTIGPVVITGTRVLWVEQTAAANQTHPWQIKSATIGDSGASTVASGVAKTGAGIRLDASGNTLVYTVGGVTDPIYGELTEVSLSNLASFKIAENAAFPTTDGRYIFWQTRATVDSPPTQKGYDTQTASLFDLPATVQSNGLPDARSGAIVWTSSSQPNLMIASANDIEAAYLWQVLPSGPRPNPGKTSPAWFYFPETSHYLSFGFKNFWTQSGGLPVFGYPLTEEFSQLNPDLGRMLTVQYLERQRFEYHPELAGTPYETSLGRLGAEDAVRRNLTGTASFQPLPITTQSSANCEFFLATRHTLCAVRLPDLGGVRRSPDWNGDPVLRASSL